MCQPGLSSYRWGKKSEHQLIQVMGEAAYTGQRNWSWMLDRTWVCKKFHGISEDLIIIFSSSTAGEWCQVLKEELVICELILRRSQVEKGFTIKSLCGFTSNWKFERFISFPRYRGFRRENIANNCIKLWWIKIWDTTIGYTLMHLMGHNYRIHSNTSHNCFISIVDCCLAILSVLSLTLCIQEARIR